MGLQSETGSQVRLSGYESHPHNLLPTNITMVIAWVLNSYFPSCKLEVQKTVISQDLDLLDYENACLSVDRIFLNTGM